MNSALTKSIILVFLIVLGYLLKRIGLFKQEDSKLLSKIMLYVTLPAMLVNAFKNFTLDVSLVGFILIGIAANAVLLFAGWKLGAKEKPRILNSYTASMVTSRSSSLAVRSDLRRISLILRRTASAPPVISAASKPPFWLRR